jgi:predicted acetyltransferase
VAHVDYISTNQNIGKGVGKMMMIMMQNKMKELDCHVIELIPLVIGFYTKLGYRLEFKKVNYYTKWLKPRPSERLIQSYERELELEDKKIAARIGRRSRGL